MMSADIQLKLELAKANEKVDEWNSDYGLSFQ